MASGSPPAGSYNVSAALRALGIRDARVIPTLASGQVLPVISFGTFETFTPEVIEARGMYSINFSGIGAGQWRGIKMLSIAPGGTIIEQCAVDVFDPSSGAPGQVVPFYFAGTARTDPWPGIGAFPTPWTIGGQALVNLINQSGIQVGNPPQAINFGGTGTGPIWPREASGEGTPFARLWVPPGFWFMLTTGQGLAQADHQCVLRWREIPQAQGAA